MKPYKVYDVKLRITNQRRVMGYYNVKGVLAHDYNTAILEALISIQEHGEKVSDFMQDYYAKIDNVEVIER